jgi:hypothetical protein
MNYLTVAEVSRIIDEREDNYYRSTMREMKVERDIDRQLDRETERNESRKRQKE